MTGAATPPQNLEAEENILGAVMLNENALDAASEIVSPSDFYRSSHGTILQAAIDLAEESKPVDVISVVELLKQRGQLDKVGGQRRLQELASLVPATANVSHYAKIVKENAGARALIAAGDSIARLGWQKPGTLDELMAQAEEKLSNATGQVIASTFAPLGESLGPVLEDIAAGLKGEPNRGLTTGFDDLDARLGGLRPGQLVLLAARPGAGKSALAQNIAENIADRKLHVAFLTLEMSGYELNLRGLARASGVDLKRILWGNAPDGAAERLREAVKIIKGRNEWLHVNDDAGINPTTLRAQLRRLQRKEGLALVVVDYIQLMQSGRNEESRQIEVAGISRSLKLLAKDLHVPVLALSQMSRAIEKRADPRPVLSDLRESGALEQDADVVLFIHRDEADQEGGVAELITAKNRMGEPGSTKLAYIGRQYAFKPLAKGTN